MAKKGIFRKKSNNDNRGTFGASSGGKMDNQIVKFYDFLRAAGGNWRNSLWIKCTFCPYGNPLCAGHLLTMDRDGSPVLFPVLQFQHLTGETLDKEECIAVLDCQDFEKLYFTYLLWKVNGLRECSLLQLGEKHNHTL